MTETKHPLVLAYEVEGVTRSVDLRQVTPLTVGDLADLHDAGVELGDLDKGKIANAKTILALFRIAAKKMDENVPEAVIRKIPFTDWVVDELLAKLGETTPRPT